MGTFKIDDLRMRAIASVQTAVTCDILGANLATYMPDFRTRWFPLTKRQAERCGIEGHQKALPHESYPAPRWPVSTHNAEALLWVLEVLAEDNPQDGHDLSTVDTSGMEPPKFKAVAVAVAIGMYAGLGVLGIDFMYQAVQLFATRIWAIEDEDTLRLIGVVARIVYRLCETGYFDSEHLAEALNSGLLSDDLTSALYWMRARALEQDEYTTYKEPAIPLQGDERTIHEACWYMMRISTQYKLDAYTTVPKECLPEVLGTTHDTADVMFLFGALCVLSEKTPNGSPYKLVIPEALTHDGPYQARIEEIFKYI